MKSLSKIVRHCAINVTKEVRIPHTGIGDGKLVKLSPKRIKMADVTQYASIIKTAIRKKRVRKEQREDMSQECYVALLERESELDPELAGKICRSRIETVLREQDQRQKKKENRIRFVSADLPSVSRLLSKIADEQEGPVSESELQEAIESLEGLTRLIIKAVYISGLTQPVAAEKLGIPLRTLQRKINRGIIELRRKFEVPDGR